MMKRALDDVHSAKNKQLDKTVQATLFSASIGPATLDVVNRDSHFKSISSFSQEKLFPAYFSFTTAMFEDMNDSFDLWMAREMGSDV